MSSVTTPAEAAGKELSGFEGRLIGPEDSDYEAARTVYNAMIDKRPALIARCASLGDVSRAIAFARDHDLLIAIRGGGHNGAGLGTCDDGVVIDLSLLKDIQVDPAARTVRVGGGCAWGEVDQATSEHGLATPSGIISTTGVGGLTLGGGLGHLTRKCGLAIDNLLEAELVLATGERVRANAQEHPDLYWAIRGGGGNFGVHHGPEQPTTAPTSAYPSGAPSRWSSQAAFSAGRTNGRANCTAVSRWPIGRQGPSSAQARS